MEHNKFDETIIDMNRQITLHFLKHVDTWGKTLNIAPLQLQILLLISKHTYTVSKLSVSFGMAKSNMSVMLKLMEKEQLIKRQKDKQDERITLIVLTKKGLNIVEKYNITFGAKAFPTIEVSEEERITIYNGLRTLLNILEKEDKKNE